MTDLLLRNSGEVNIAPKLRVNHHGWVEHYDETGSVMGLTPAHEVEDVIVGVERYTDLPEFSKELIESYEITVEKEVGKA